MKFPKHILVLIYFLGIFSNVLYANATNCEICDTSYQTDITPASKTISESFFNKKLIAFHITEVSNCVKFVSVKKGTFPKFITKCPVLSEEKKWLGLLYLDEDGKLAIHSNGAVLSRENSKFFKNPNLVKAWRALDNIGVDDAIRKNTDYLKNVDDYAKRSGKSTDEVADLAKNNENGIEQFLDELENTPASGHWDKNPFQRGRDIEDDLGQNLPETFKTIDKYDDVTGEATSIKSLDLDAKTYQTPSKLRSRLNKYLDELDDFDGYQLEGVEIGDIESPINSKTLELAIPRAATGEQLNVLNELVSNGASKGINVKIVEFP